MTDYTAEREVFSELFEKANLVINDLQAAALAHLMADGEHSGTTLPRTTPPTAVALQAIGARESLGDRPLHHPLTGEYVTDHEHPDRVAMGPDPLAHTVVVLAEDGRWWQIVRAGICWPGEWFDCSQKDAAA
jgi:hypothetical protein